MGDPPWLSTPVALITAAVFGTIWGSFFNVCIARVPRGQSVVRPPSHCFSCGRTVKPWDNIPILSYLLLRGRCRFCGVHFSPRYLLIGGRWRDHERYAITAEDRRAQKSPS